MESPFGPMVGTAATALYRYFRPDGGLLYAGISNQPEMRHLAHLKSAYWIGHAEFWRMEWFPMREIAEWAEYVAIGDEKPEYNRKHQFRPMPTKFIDRGGFLKANGYQPVGISPSWYSLDHPLALFGHVVPCDQPPWYEPPTAKEA